MKSSERALSDRPQNKNLTPWKPGQSGNPNGYRTRWNITPDKLRKIIDEMCCLKFDDLQKMVTDKKGTAIELQIAATMIRSVVEGDFSRIASLMDRLCGKVRDDVQVTVNRLRDELQNKSIEELMVLAKIEPLRIEGGE